MFCFYSLCSISPFSHMVTFRCAISLLIKWRKTSHFKHYTSLSNLLSYPVTMIDGPSLSAFECLYYTAMCILEWEGGRGRFLFLIKHPWKKKIVLVPLFQPLFRHYHHKICWMIAAYIKEFPCICKQSTFAVHVSEADTRECILDAVNNQNKSQILILGKI